MKLIFSLLFSTLSFSLLFSQQPILNPDFGDNGKTLINFNEKSSEIFAARAVQVTNDNSVVAGGRINDEYALQKINLNGNDDSSFGKKGFYFFDFGTGPFNSGVQEILRYPDGNILIIGIASPSISQINRNTSSMAVAMVRLLPNGKQDVSFGISGKVTYNWPTFDLWVHSGILQPDGKIIIAARAASYQSPGISSWPLLIRFNQNGSIDNSFGIGGIFVIPQAAAETSPLERKMALAIQPDGKIVLGDLTPNGNILSPAIFRITPLGRLDSTFGINGKFLHGLGLTSTYEIRSILLQPDNKIVFAGNTRGQPSQMNWLMARIRPDGKVDSSFGNNGIFIHTNSSWQRKAIGEIRLGDNDQIVAAAFHHTGTQSVIDVFRMKPNGTFDSSFAAASIIYQRAMQANYFIVDVKMVLDNDKNPVVLGYTTHYPDLNSLTHIGHAILRVTKDGVALPAFNSGGIEQYTNPVTPALGPDYNYGSEDRMRQMEQFSNGKILLAGNILNSRNNSTFIALTRLHANGKVDSSFGINGRKTYPQSQPINGLSLMLKLADEKILISNQNLSLFKIDSSGKTDSSFGTNGIAMLNIPAAPFPYVVKDIAEQPDKKILVLTNSQILRLNINGSSDNSFGVNGFVSLNQSFGQTGVKIKVQEDGTIIVGCHAPSNGGAYFHKYNSSGTVDNSFGTNGIARIRVTLQLASGESAFYEFLHDFKILPDGKLILLMLKDRNFGIPNSQNPQIIANGSNYRDIILYRANANGSIDNTFGGVPNSVYFNGTSHLSLPFVEEIPGTLTVAPDGKLAISGFFNRGAGWDAGLIILKANGRYDTTCSVTGLTTAGEDNIIQSRTVFDDRSLSHIQLKDGNYLLGMTQFGQSADYAVLNFLSPYSPNVTYSDFDAQKDTCLKVDLDWSTNNECNIDSFFIEYSRDSLSFQKIGTLLAVGNPSPINNYSFVHNPANYGNNYYRLRAVANNVAYGSSTIKNVIIPNPPLGVITWQNAVPVLIDTLYNVQLNWSILNEALTQFIILQMSTDSVSFTTIHTMNAAGTVAGITNYSYTVPGLSQGKYFFRILLNGNNCRETTSNIKSVLLLPGCSDKLKLFPNPTRSDLTVLIPDCENGDLRLINMLGQVISIIPNRAGGSRVDIKCQHLAAGMYFIQFLGDKTKTVLKFEKL